MPEAVEVGVENNPADSPVDTRPDQVDNFPVYIPQGILVEAAVESNPADNPVDIRPNQVDNFLVYTPQGTLVEVAVESNPADIPVRLSVAVERTILTKSMIEILPRDSFRLHCNQARDTIAASLDI
jgi:hypothetical protein